MLNKNIDKFKMSFTKDELSLIYEGVKHMGFHRDVLEKENKIGEVTRNVLDKIESADEEVISPMYVTENLEHV